MPRIEITDAQVRQKRQDREKEGAKRIKRKKITRARRTPLAATCMRWDNAAGCARWGPKCSVKPRGVLVGRTADIKRASQSRLREISFWVGWCKPCLTISHSAQTTCGLLFDCIIHRARLSMARDEHDDEVRAWRLDASTTYRTRGVAPLEEPKINRRALMSYFLENIPVQVEAALQKSKKPYKLIPVRFVEEGGTKMGHTVIMNWDAKVHGCRRRRICCRDVLSHPTRFPDCVAQRLEFVVFYSFSAVSKTRADVGLSGDRTSLCSSTSWGGKIRNSKTEPPHVGDGNPWGNTGIICFAKLDPMDQLLSQHMILRM